MTLRDYKNTVLAILLKAKNKSRYSICSYKYALNLSTSCFISSHLHYGFVCAVLPSLALIPELVTATIPEVDPAVESTVIYSCFALLLRFVELDPSLEPSTSIGVSIIFR